MKKYIVFITFLLMTVGLHAATFTIEPYPPATEPLNPGDSVNISSSSGFTGHSYSDGWWIFYYQGFELGEVHFSTHFLQVSGDYLIGQQPLEVGALTWADEIRMHVATAFPPYQYHWFSENTLLVNPSTLPVPSLNIWGIFLLISGVSIWLIWKR